MHKVITTVAMALTLASGASAAADEIRPYSRPFSATYGVEMDGFSVGELKRSFRVRDNGTYVLKSKMYTTGLAALFKEDTVVERSTGKLSDGGVKPFEYYYRHEGRGGEHIERLIFDWSEGTIKSVRDEETNTLEIIPGVLEKQIYQLVLRKDLAAGKKAMNYEVADRGDIRTYRFRVRGEETIETELGELRAIKVERLSHSKERKTFIWCSIEHDYQLVRLIQEDDGHTIASHIEKLDS